MIWVAMRFQLLVCITFETHTHTPFSLHSAEIRFVMLISNPMLLFWLSHIFGFRVHEIRDCRWGTAGSNQHTLQAAATFPIIAEEERGSQPYARCRCLAVTPAIISPTPDPDPQAPPHTKEHVWMRTFELERLALVMGNCRLLDTLLILQYHFI